MIARRSPLRQCGAALILALLVTAMAATVATALIGRIDRWSSEVIQRRDLGQARVVALVGIDYARAVLGDDARRNNIDHPGEGWANPMPMTEAEGGEIGGQIEDQQGLWNLNNLAPDGKIDPLAHAAYQRLLDGLGLPAELANTLGDWLDSDHTALPGGAESSYYLSRPAPYPAANAPLSDLGNLSRIKGYTPAVIETLRPHVTVLPGAQPINANFASARLLAALFPDLTLANAEQIVLSGRRTPFRDGLDLRNRFEHLNLPSPAAPLSGTSQFFIVHIRGRFADAHLAFDALLRRIGQSEWPTTVWIKQP